ncbi:hypothetical protein C4Q31_16635 [Leptospira borgpetersenii serovar Ceylonica]|nr:hypothetical protein C4Q31_16635 [Leptospira borgpetersenii serovar Ceylonica]
MALSGLKKRGLDASINHKTRKPTEGTKSFPKIVFIQKTENFTLRFARSRQKRERCYITNLECSLRRQKSELSSVFRIWESSSFCEKFTMIVLRSFGTNSY